MKTYSFDEHAGYNRVRRVSFKCAWDVFDEEQKSKYHKLGYAEAFILVKNKLKTSTILNYISIPFFLAFFFVIPIIIGMGLTSISKSMVKDAYYLQIKHIEHINKEEIKKRNSFEYTLEYLGVVESMSINEKNKILAAQYNKYNQQIISSNKEISERAEKMVEFIAVQRKQLNG